MPCVEFTQTFRGVSYVDFQPSAPPNRQNCSWLCWNLSRWIVEYQSPRAIPISWWWLSLRKLLSRDHCGTTHIYLSWPKVILWFLWLYWEYKLFTFVWLCWNFSRLALNLSLSEKPEVINLRFKAPRIEFTQTFRRQPWGCAHFSAGSSSKKSVVTPTFA